MDEQGGRDLPTGTVTLLFTDIEGSTALREQYPAVVAEHDDIIRSALAGFGGHEISTQGDPFFASFRHASDAVAYNAEIQPSWPSTVSGLTASYGCA